MRWPIPTDSIFPCKKDIKFKPPGILITSLIVSQFTGLSIKLVYIKFVS